MKVTAKQGFKYSEDGTSVKRASEGETIEAGEKLAKQLIKSGRASAAKSTKSTKPKEDKAKEPKDDKSAKPKESK